MDLLPAFIALLTFRRVAKAGSHGGSNFWAS